MRFIVMTILAIFNISVFCRRTAVIDSDENDHTLKELWKIFSEITRSKETEPFNLRKSSNQIKYFYKTLSNNVDISKFKNWLRHEATGDVEEIPAIDEVREEMAGLVENELLNALSKKASALLDRPYVQKKGRNDFLVIRPDQKDPFVTIVPNDIYYNVEKKCINWLDDCNQKGIRDRLLQKVNAPYK